MKRAGAAFAVGAAIVLMAGTAHAAELKPETLQAWEQYAAAARAGAGEKFSLSEDQRRAERLRGGEIPVRPMHEHGATAVPGGLIHDWVGIAFIPNVKAPEMMGLLQNYGRYKDIYQPLVIDSRALSHTENEDRYSMRWMHKVLFVTAALDAEYEANIVRVDEHRFYAISRTTCIHQIQNYGQPSERILPPDQGDGYIWRMMSIARFEERDGGVYAELEAIVLTRDIPSSLRWMMKPVVSKLSRNSLAVSLAQTRGALTGAARGAELPERAPGNASESGRENLARSLQH